MENQVDNRVPEGNICGVLFPSNTGDGNPVQACEFVNICQVIPLLPTDKPFTYVDIAFSVSMMDLVCVEFGRRNVLGLCIECIKLPTNGLEEVFRGKFGFDYSKAKTIKEVVLKSVFRPNNWEFLKHFSDYNVLSLGQAIDMGLPPSLYTASNKITFSSFTIPPQYYLSNDSPSPLNRVGQEKLIRQNHPRLTKTLRVIFFKLLDLIKPDGRGCIAGSFILEQKIAKPISLSKLVSAGLLEQRASAVVPPGLLSGCTKDGLQDGALATKIDGEGQQHCCHHGVQDNLASDIPTATFASFSNDGRLCNSGGTRGKENELDSALNLDGLSEEQQACVKEIIKFSSCFNAFLLYGVTGAGKTEVYVRIIEDIIQRNSSAQVLILLPEITMTSSMVIRLQSRFGFSLALWHSSLTPATKQNTIRQVASGEAKVVLGVRSAVLLPFPNLGLIVVDEEHDWAYKQEDSPTYNARDMAVMRAKICNIPVVLGSATPSVESYRNAQIGKYRLLTIVGRFSKIQMPKVTIQDTNKNKLLNKILTKESLDKILQTVGRQEQVMIFINRRGYARMMSCNSCGASYDCPNCDNKLVYHQNRDRLLCHYCQHSIYKPKECTYCGDTLFPLYLGPIGIERVEEELRELIPNSVIGVMSSDTMHDELYATEFMDKVQNNETNIILSTQIGSKGYNFKHLTLVVAIGIDVDHIEGDFRIFERTYQLLVQVCGRAGRFEKQGEMIIQTKNHNNPVLQAIASGDAQGFYELELTRRKGGNLPPYSRQICITVASASREKSHDYTVQVYRQIADQIFKNNNYGDIKLLGPIPSVMHKLKRQYRYNILLRHESGNKLRQLIVENLAVLRPTSNLITVKIDVDPNSIA